MKVKRIPITPRGLSERQAATLWGVSAGTHRKMVGLGIAPPPLELPGIGRRLYDRQAQERAIEACAAKPAGAAAAAGAASVG